MEGAREMPALGRPFQLGSLYDVRRDSLIPDVTLWDADLLQKQTLTKDRPWMGFQLFPSESLANKASALDLKGSLKASFFGGLFEVGGAATYLEEHPPSGSHARVTLHLSVMTQWKSVSPALLNQQMVSCRHGSATHIVTALQYGAQAFFVFDCGVSKSEVSRDVQQHLLEMIQKVPKVADGGQDSHRWSDAEKEMQGKIHCTLYGDIIPPENLTTFQEALDIYINFCQIFGDRGKAVPVRVWLSPVITSAPQATRMVQDPPLGWLRETEAHLQALIQVDLRCQELIRSPAAALFPEMKDHIKQLRALCWQHGLVFRQALGKALLGIRTGRDEAGVLGGLFSLLLRSPFHWQALKKLLVRKTREADFVNLCLSRLEGLEVIPAANKLEEILFDGRNKVVVAFVLTSLHMEAPSLDGLRAWLSVEDGGEPATSEKEASSSQLWFEDEERKQWIRCAVSSLSDFAKIQRERKNDVRFLVSSVWDESHPGASVYLYVNGQLVNQCLELPSTAAPPEVELCHPSSVWIRVNPVSFGAGSVSRYQVEYQMGGDQCLIQWTSLDMEGRPENGVNLDIQQKTAYQFRCAAVTQIGIGGWSEIVSLSPTGKLGKEAPLPGWAEFRRRAHGGEAPELRVILVGKTGGGKSATGNTILKRKHFASEMSLQTITRSCQTGERRLKDRKILVVDTPGICDPERSERATSIELKKCLQLCPPGPHAIIHILKIGKFTMEEKETVRLLKNIFQDKALRYVIVLFTGKEDLEGESLESFVSVQDRELKQYITECGNRCLAFSNRAEGADREGQVEELIQMVQDLVEKNQDAPYYLEETSKGSSWLGNLF